MQDMVAIKAEPIMPTDSRSQNQVDIAVIKRDIENIRSTFQQSESAIGRLERVASDISRNASVHEQKINSQDRWISDVERVLESQRQENNSEIQALNARINTVNNELSSKINQTERAILTEIQQMKFDLSKKIAEIDMYRYMVMGGIAVVIFFLSKAIDVVKIFN
jgi:chromosome segregation ATPase